MAGRASRTIYVGNLPLDVKELEIEDLFYKVLFTFSTDNSTSIECYPFASSIC